MRPSETFGGAGAAGISVRALLAGYDDEVRASLGEARSSHTGTERVRLLHNRVRRSVAVHDGVLRSALCPLLDELPGGPPIADRLRQGCDERARLLGRFEAVTKNIAAPNVYPVSGPEIEEILEGLDRSFERHVIEETTEVADALEAVADSLDPEVVAARMALEAERAPTRVHAGAMRHPDSALRKRIYRNRDRRADWSSSHHGWADPLASRPSPLAMQVEGLFRAASGAAPTVTDLLAGYDGTVEGFIAEVGNARGDADKADAARRMNAAITIHDAVLAGVLCPLLESVPDSKTSAAELREGCALRSDLLGAWQALAKKVSAAGLTEEDRAESDRIVAALIESFTAHAEVESSQVNALFEKLSTSNYRTKTSALSDAMWPWHSEGPELLAIRMALWAKKSPHRTHALLVRHPSSGVLRSMYHLADYWHEFFEDTPLGRWLLPKGTASAPARTSSPPKS